MLKKRQAEFPHLPPVDYKIIENDEQIKIGNISVKFFGVTHSIPDSMGIIIKTPYGGIVNPVTSNSLTLTVLLPKKKKRNTPFLILKKYS